MTLSVATPSLLRVATAGSVDDGKSTLIGRLLHDTKTLFEDQLAAVEQASRRRGDGYVNLALLTDGLRAEREQGITIDVAYRYFATPVRSFIVADTPGHAQYTRNMVTGASTSDVAIVLVDARNGLTEQSRRHLYLSALLGVRHVILAVNKMDLVDFDVERFDGVVAEATGYVGRLPSTPPVTAIPISALHGDNVVEPSPRTPWYDGPPLLGFLETVDVATNGERPLGARLHVQWVIRPMSDEHHDYRAYAGQLAGGALRPGDTVRVLPAGTDATVAAIDAFDQSLDVAVPGQSIAVRLAEHVDVGRGDVLAATSPGAVAPLVGPRGRRRRVLDDRPAGQAGRALLDQARHPLDEGRHLRAGARPRRQHADAPGRSGGARPQRPRAHPPAERHAARRRSLRREPDDRRVRDRRRGHQHDGGRRDDQGAHMTGEAT